MVVGKQLFGAFAPLPGLECGSERLYARRSGVLLLLLHAPNLDLTMAKTFTITPLILILVFFDKNKLVLMPLHRILETSLTYAVLDIDVVMFVMTEED